MQRQKFYALVLCALLVTFTLTGCAGDNNASERRVISAAESQINAHPAEDFKNGGILRLPLSHFPEQWNYYHAQGNSADARIIENALLPRAFYFDLDGKPTPSEDYFEDIVLSANDNAQQVTYKIHPKARWSNGEPITWRDLEATWKANNQSNPDFQARPSSGWKGIKAVTPGATEREAIVHFEKKISDWKALFSPIYPASLYQHPNQFNTNWAKNIPMTSGPFKLQKVDPSLQTVTVIRDESWWGEKPKLDAIVFRALSGDSDIEAYLEQEIDFVETQGKAERYEKLRDAENTDFRTTSSAKYRYISFNSAGALADSQVRRALTKAINRKALFNAEYRGIPYAAQPLNHHFFLTSDPRYEDNAKGIANYNIAVANQELDKTGWVINDTVRSKAQQTLQLRLLLAEGSPADQNIAQLIKEQLQEAYVDVEIVAVPVTDFYRSYIYPGNFDLALLSASNPGYPSTLYDIFSEGDASRNYGHISNAKITETLETAAETLEQRHVVELLNTADKQVWQEGHSLPLSQLPKINAVRPALANYGATVGFVDVNWTKVGWLRDELVKTRP